MNEHFINGFCKTAAEKEEKHYLRRALLGNPISGAIKAKEGKKWQTFKDTYLHHLKNSLLGAGGGAALGSGLGALSSLRKGKATALERLLIGAAAGFGVGGAAGSAYGTFGDKATGLHNRYAKNK